MPPMMGRVIENGKPMINGLFNLGFGAELIYSFVVIVCCMMIYFGTKELYELSSHKGIKYFRISFLFFAIAFFFRSSVKFLLMFIDIPRSIVFSPIFFGTITLFFFIYASSMAIFYLLYSLIWRRWKFGKTGIIILHALAIIISFVSVFSRNVLIIFLLQFVMFLFVAIFGYSVHNKNRKNKNQIYFAYLLLFLFWILNILDILIPDFVVISKLAIYISSLGLFLFITYKVLRTIGAN